MGFDISVMSLEFIGEKNQNSFISFRGTIQVFFKFCKCIKDHLLDT